MTEHDEKAEEMLLAIEFDLICANTAIEHDYICVGVSRDLYDYMNKKAISSVFENKINLFLGYPILVVDGMTGYSAFIMKEVFAASDEEDKEEQE